MKTLLNRVFLIVLCVALCMCFWACGDEEEADGNDATMEKEGLGLEYTLSDDGAYYIVTGIGECEKESISIPATFEEKPVKAIGENAFKGCKQLKSVVIPGSVLSVGESAFEECVNLKSVKMEEGTLKLGNCSFKGCTALKSVNLPKGLSEIGYASFINCVDLTKIEIPDTVSVIQYNTFNKCYKLARVKIGAGVTEIQENAFSDCYCLVEVENCSDNITVDSGNTNGGVGVYALNIGNSDGDFVSKLAFDNAGYALYTSGSDKIFMSFNGDGKIVTVPEGATAIYKYAFYNSKNVMKVELSDSVTDIGEMAFYDCENLLVLNVGTGFKTAVSSSFSGCRKLVEIVNKSSVSFTSSSNPVCRLYYASEFLMEYSEDIVSENRVKLTEDGFIVLIDSRDVKGKRFGKVLVGYMGNETDIVIPKDVDYIHSYAFYNNDKIKSVTIGEDTEYLSESAFEGCVNLAKVDIVVDKNSIYYEQGPNLSVGYHAGLYSIGDRCFANCSSLKEILIPKTVKRIGYYAFYDCGDIKLFCEEIRNPEEYYGGYSYDMGCSTNNIYWYSYSDSLYSDNIWHYVDGKVVIWE